MSEALGLRRCMSPPFKGCVASECEDSASLARSGTRAEHDVRNGQGNAGRLGEDGGGVLSSRKGVEEWSVCSTDDK